MRPALIILLMAVMITITAWAVLRRSWPPKLRSKMSSPEGDSENRPRGPSVYENWNASIDGQPSTRGYEVPLFTDAHVTGEITEGYGPYQFLNPVATGTKLGTLVPGVILRAEEHYAEDTQDALEQVRLRGTDDKRYHGGWLFDEVAALCSLALGARFRPGAITRLFEPSTDPRGKPIHWMMYADPALPERHGPLRIPGAQGKKALVDLRPLLALPALSPPDAIIVVKAARLYQDALWIAEAEPELTWIMLVSAVECAADHWRQEAEAPLDQLRAWGPGKDLEKLMRGEANGSLLQRVAELLAPYVGSQRKFVDFVIRFCPDPPTGRPGEVGQHSWDSRELAKTLKQVYGYRSKALHAGKRFPAPMSAAPLKAQGWDYPAEVPIALSAATAGGSWLQEDTRILLHTFEYIVRGALLKWLYSMAPPRPEQSN